MDGDEEAIGETRGEEESRGSERDHTFDTGGARVQFHLAADGARVLVLLVRQDELLALHLVCPTFFPLTIPMGSVREVGRSGISGMNAVMTSGFSSSSSSSSSPASACFRFNHSPSKGRMDLLVKIVGVIRTGTRT